MECLNYEEWDCKHRQFMKKITSLAKDVDPIKHGKRVDIIAIPYNGKELYLIRTVINNIFYPPTLCYKEAEDLFEELEVGLYD